MGKKNSEKWSVLINAARMLIQQKGYDRTSLADIAAESGIPFGNFYNYFRTKQAIGEAVVKEVALEYQNFFNELNVNLDPKIRLILFFQSSLEEPKTITHHRRELNNLYQELAKKGGILANQTTKLFEEILIWCKIQFDSLGFKKEAVQLACHLITGLQGAYLLAQVFKNPILLKQQIDHIQTWLEHVILENKSFAGP